MSFHIYPLDSGQIALPASQFRSQATLGPFIPLTDKTDFRIVEGSANAFDPTPQFNTPVAANPVLVQSCGLQAFFLGSTGVTVQIINLASIVGPFVVGRNGIAAVIHKPIQFKLPIFVFTQGVYVTQVAFQVVADFQNSDGANPHNIELTGALILDY